VTSSPPAGEALPALLTAVPGPSSRALVDVLAAHECPAITARRARRASALGLGDDDPFVWAEAVGANVVDVDGNRFVDLTAGFAVALAGHRHPAIVAAVHRQSERLLHAMGDAWPDAARIHLLRALAELAPPGLEVSLLGLSGSDAIDAAVKTALLATGRPGVLTFEGGYHGLALGVLGLQAYKAAFTDPFRAITHGRVQQLPFGCPGARLEERLATGEIGLVLVEPLQGRGGMRPAPDGWLAELVTIAHRHGAVVAFDEIQSGLGRTGTVWAADGVVPDLLCTGKALGGGFPISACIGTRAVMNAWGASTGEALHTQTFLGHPIGCAAALATIDLVKAGLPQTCASRGARLRAALQEAGHGVRGRGLMLGVELGPESFAISRALLRRGYIVLPAGLAGEVLGLTPPASLTDAQQDGFVAALGDAISEVRR
jgi:4-aminobutyrate aminotransferase/(S)-3-amino-2-methylpropionate transaminase